jgi:peptidoglycan/LPS O-acetylase OafA/YrhL
VLDRAAEAGAGLTVRSARDPVSLVAGIAVTALGALLLLDQADAIELTFGWLGAALAAMLGVILVISGIFQGEN